jgi:hypothetical protein
MRASSGNFSSNPITDIIRARSAFISSRTSTEDLLRKQGAVENDLRH